MAGNAELAAFVEQLIRLTRPEDLFGTVSDRTALHKHYRALARIAHADRYILPADKLVAHDAFTRLTALYQAAEERLKNGTYGTSAPTHPVTITTKRTTYTITSVLAGGDLTTVYRAKDGDGRAVLLKMARAPRDNDLLDREQRTLSRLHEAALAYSFKRYLPEPIESFVTQGQSAGRWTNVFVDHREFVPLTRVHEKYPNGIDPRHYVWVWNRVLTILGFVHSQGIVHGAVLPPHLLINPANHGLMLIDWAFAVPTGQPIAAMSDGYRGWYAPEVPKKRAAGPATDIWMAATTMAWLLGDRCHVAPHSSRVCERGTSSCTTHHQRELNLPASVPAVFRRFLEACRLPAQARRPQDAFTLLTEFRKAAETTYGKRKFIALSLT